MKDWIEYG